jgi:predicted acyltransferase
MAKHERLTSLDAFRGFTIAGMMLVNNPGSWSAIYPQLEHASWNGWTFTDFIFPFFLWIVGVAMTFSFAYRKERGDSDRTLLLQVFRRAVIIFLLGLFLTAFPFGALGTKFSLSTLRIPGVLQRIAICYFIASLIYLKTTFRGQIRVIAILLAAYWLAVKWIPVPGYGAGVLDPMGNLVWYIDSILLHGHTWAGAPAVGGDPEGILSTIPAIATTLLGALTGQYLRNANHSKEEKTIWMFIIGAALLFFGAWFDMYLPINKNMWTSSYAIFMAGWAMTIFSIFYYLIDVKGYRAWATPLVIYGMNAIFVFVLSGVLGRLFNIIKFNVLLSDGTFADVGLKTLITQNLINPFFSPLMASLVYAILWDLMLFLFAWGMWKKKWFLKV